MQGAPTCEGCPFTAFPMAAATDTRTPSEAGPQEPPPAPTAGPDDSRYAVLQVRRHPPSASPPLALLSTLRI
jgi:hypothetical protein